jgi:hypothetical protein
MPLIRPNAVRRLLHAPAYSFAFIKAHLCRCSESGACEAGNPRIGFTEAVAIEFRCGAP